MASKLDRLLQEIHPARTIDEAHRRIDDAVNSFPMNRARVTDFSEFQAFLVKLHGHVEACILRLNGGLPRTTFDFSWGRCAPIFNQAFGSGEGWKAAFEMARTGNDGGLYAVVRRIAAVIADRYTQDWVAALVWNYWNVLSTAEKQAATAEYLERFGHLLPTELTEGSAGRLQANFPKVLQEHPKLLQRLRQVGR